MSILLDPRPAADGASCCDPFPAHARAARENDGDNERYDFHATSWCFMADRPLSTTIRSMRRVQRIRTTEIRAVASMSGRLLAASRGVRPGSSGVDTFFGAFGFSSGALPADRMEITRFSMSNQNGAPSVAARAVISHPSECCRIRSPTAAVSRGIAKPLLACDGVASHTHPIGSPSSVNFF